MEQARQAIEATKPDLILVYSTMWPSILGHQVQADPSPTWVLVDELFHDLGSIPYTLRMDSAFAEAWVEAGRARGLQMRTVAYEGFPIDVGSVVALKLPRWSLCQYSTLFSAMLASTGGAACPPTMVGRAAAETSTPRVWPPKLR